MIKAVPSKSGLQYAIANNHKIHSSYDPYKEALRFIDNTVKGKPRCFLILGPGLGYLQKVIRGKFPGVRCLSVFYSDEFYNRFTPKDHPCWNPSNKLSLRDFLEANINDIEINGLQIIEWSQTAKAFPSVSSKINTALGQFIREKNGSIVTTKLFGKRWIKNSLYNFLYLKHLHTIPMHHLPILITASGPSLISSLEIIQKIRKHIRLWALPSSLTALLYNNIIPDLIIVSDPGHYTTMHLHSLFQDHPIPVALPLSAARGIIPNGVPVVPLCQNYFFENQLFRRVSLEPISIIANGTVAGTALDLALSYSDNNVYFIGLDFSYEDLHSHASPHAFELLFASRENRLDPYINTLYSRVISCSKKVSSNQRMRTTLPLKTYAGWFSHRSKSIERKLFRINPLPLPVEGIYDISGEEAMHTIFSSLRPSLPVENENDKQWDNYSTDFGTRRRVVIDLLQEWIEQCTTFLNAIPSNDKVWSLFTTSLLFDLFYYIDISGIIEIYRTFSVDGEDKSVELINAVTKKNIKFLKNCREDIINR